MDAGGVMLVGVCRTAVQRRSGRAAAGAGWSGRRREQVGAGGSGRRSVCERQRDAGLRAASGGRWADRGSGGRRSGRRWRRTGGGGGGRRQRRAQVGAAIAAAGAGR